MALARSIAVRIKISLLVWLMMALLAATPHPAVAQTGISVTDNLLYLDFPYGVFFWLSTSSTSEIQTVRLHYWTNGATCQAATAQEEMELDPDTEVTLTWWLDFSLTGILPPGSQIFWQWEITNAAGSTMLTQVRFQQINDDRHDWNSLSSGQVTLQWFRGNTSFGQAALDIAIGGLERLATQAGVQPTGQIWISIYPTPQEVQEVIIYSPEWAAGIAFPAFNSIILAVSPDELAWARDAIPHEISHLVVATLIFNCQGIVIPTWLNEGLAVYAEGDQPDSELENVLGALESGNLPPLYTLESGFSPNPNEALRSYMQSYMVVDYLISEHGSANLAALLAAMQGGSTLDEAMLEIYGFDTFGLDAAWRNSLGYTAPTPAPTVATTTRTPVPTLALWTPIVGASVTPTPTATPTATSTPASTHTPQPVTRVPSATPSVPSSTPAPGILGLPRAWLIILAACLCGGSIFLAALIAALTFAIRRRVKT